MYGSCHPIQNHMWNLFSRIQSNVKFVNECLFLFSKTYKRSSSGYQFTNSKQMISCISHHEAASSSDQVVIAQDPGLKKCAICHLPSRSKKEYLIHYKQRHSGYKLGCPKCPQTYHSPELLHAHYTHFHLRGTPIFQGTPSSNKRAHILLRCEYCDVSTFFKVFRAGEHPLMMSKKSDIRK